MFLLILWHLAWDGNPRFLFPRRIAAESWKFLFRDFYFKISISNQQYTETGEILHLCPNYYWQTHDHILFQEFLQISRLRQVEDILKQSNAINFIQMVIVVFRKTVTQKFSSTNCCESPEDNNLEDNLHWNNL